MRTLVSGRSGEKRSWQTHRMPRQRAARTTPPLEGLLLFVLGRSPGTLGVLARAVRRYGVAHATLVAAVRRLEQAGLVFRGADGITYRLSQRGRRRLAFERLLGRLLASSAKRRAGPG
jgi:DNA-binding MarR family transcriptional regulator